LTLSPPISTRRSPKIDLQLLAGRRLKANRRPCFGLQFAPQRRDRPLDRAQAQLEPLLGKQLLAHDIGVLGVPAKPLGHPILKSGQHPASVAAAIRQPAALRHVMPNRHVAAAQFARDPLDAPPQPFQPQHRRDLVRRLHHLPPR